MTDFNNNQMNPQPEIPEVQAAETQPPVQDNPAQPQYTQPQYTQPQYTAPQGQPVPPQYPVQNPQAPNFTAKYDVPPVGYQQKSRLAAGILGLMFGCFGVHNFYLGNNTKAIIQLIVCLAGSLLCGIGPIVAEIWGIVEGIMLISNHPSTRYDGNGVILKD